MKKIINISVFLILILNLNFIFSSLPRKKVVLKNFNGLKKTLVGAGIFSFLYLIDRYNLWSNFEKKKETCYKQYLKEIAVDEVNLNKYITDNIDIEKNLKNIVYLLFMEYELKFKNYFFYPYQLNEKNLTTVLNSFETTVDQKEECSFNDQEIKLTKDQINKILKKVKTLDIYYKNPFEKLIGWIGSKFKEKENIIQKKK